jgi:hypothetical protein
MQEIGAPLFTSLEYISIAHPAFHWILVVPAFPCTHHLVRWHFFTTVDPESFTSSPVVASLL